MAKNWVQRARFRKKMKAAFANQTKYKIYKGKWVFMKRPTLKILGFDGIKKYKQYIEYFTISFMGIGYSLGKIVPKSNE